MKQKFEKATHKTVGVIIALAAVPIIIVLVIVWIVTGMGGKAADLIARGNHEKEENYKSDF